MAGLAPVREPDTCAVFHTHPLHSADLPACLHRHQQQQQTSGPHPAAAAPSSAQPCSTEKASCQRQPEYRHFLQITKVECRGASFLQNQQPDEICPLKRISLFQNNIYHNEGHKIETISYYGYTQIRLSLATHRGINSSNSSQHKSQV